MREGISNVDPVGALEKTDAQRIAEIAGADERVDMLLPESVEKGKAADITAIDVLEASGESQSSPTLPPHYLPAAGKLTRTHADDVRTIH